MQAVSYYLWHDIAIEFQGPQLFLAQLFPPSIGRQPEKV